MISKLGFGVVLFSALWIACQDSPTEPAPKEYRSEWIEVTDYVKNQHYFLDNYYYQQYAQFDERGEKIVEPENAIKHIRLFKSAASYQSNIESILGWAIAAKNDDWLEQEIIQFDTINVDWTHTRRAFFIEMQKDVDYTVDKNLGTISLTLPVKDGEALAVAFETIGGKIRGDISFNPDREKTIFLKMIRVLDPTPVNATWKLEMRNIYHIDWGEFYDAPFQIKVLFKPPSGDTQAVFTKDGNEIYYTSALGVDWMNEQNEPSPDGNIDSTFFTKSAHQLVLSDPRPFDPLNSSLRAMWPEDKLFPQLYDSKDKYEILKYSRYFIELLQEK